MPDTKEKRLEYFLEACKLPEVTDWWYDPRILQPETQHPVWHSGVVLEIEFLHRYALQIKAVDTPKLVWYEDGEDKSYDICETFNEFERISWLNSHGIRNDEDLNQAQDDKNLIIQVDNYFEAYIEDMLDGKTIAHYDYDIEPVVCVSSKSALDMIKAYIGNKLIMEWNKGVPCGWKWR